MKQLTTSIQLAKEQPNAQRQKTGMTSIKYGHEINMTYPDWISHIPVVFTLINIIFFMNHSYKINPVMTS